MDGCRRLAAQHFRYAGQQHAEEAFHVGGPAAEQAPLALGDLGIAAIGTLVAALAVRTRARDLLGPLLALPLLVPVVIGAARASAPLLALGSGHDGVGGVPIKWLATLALYDLVFGLIAYAVFDFLLED